MHSKRLEDCHAGGRDGRWRDAHAEGVALQKERLIKDGMDPRRAERQAVRMQTGATERARAGIEGRD